MQVGVTGVQVATAWQVVVVNDGGEVADLRLALQPLPEHLR